MECEAGKLFVGGLSRETSEKTLKEYFSKYGEVKECQILRDWNIGQSRGFGFVSFVETDHVHQAIHDCKHPMIDGKLVEVKHAKPREKRPQHQNGYSNTLDDHDHEFKTTKIFVGGLSSNLTEKDFKKYFEEFGQVNDSVIIYDMKTRIPRGFGFITFDSVDAVEHVLQRQKIKFHELGNKTVEVKRATPKNATRIDIYNPYKTAFELGFGRDAITYGSDYSSEFNHPYVYYRNEANPYNGGLFYYFCPSLCMLPVHRDNHVTSCFKTFNKYTARCSQDDHGSRGVNINDEVDNNVGNQDQADHATDSSPRGVHINGEVDDNVGNKEQANHTDNEASGLSDVLGSSNYVNGDPQQRLSLVCMSLTDNFDHSKEADNGQSSPSS